MFDFINKINEHALTAEVGVGDKVLVTTTTRNQKGVVIYVSRHGDIVSVKFPGEDAVITVYADQVHPLREGVLDVISRDKTFPFHRYFHKINNQVVRVSSEPISGGNWKRVEDIVGTEDDFVDLVKTGKIRNVVSTRPLGKGKESFGKEKTKESANSELEELDCLCRSLADLDESFYSLILENGISPESFGDLSNSIYTNFLLRMKEEIRNRRK
jgi:hypothetical protein